VDTFGRLYTWYAVTDIRNVCPTGWHIPTHEEWTKLITYLGGEDVAGRKLKKAGDDLWLIPGTNESGFSALPGGIRSKWGFYYYLGENGYWWTTEGNNLLDASYRYLVGQEHSRAVLEYSESKATGVSVRCVRD
jgi:uncharacterized protein (TIGR02145 family)